MQTPTRMNKVGTEDYYNLTPMDGNLNWVGLTYLLSKFSLNPTAPFCTSTFTLTFLIASLNVHTRKQ